MSRFSFLPSSLAWRRFFARTFDSNIEGASIVFVFLLIFGKNLYLNFGKNLYLNQSFWILLSIITLPLSLILNSFICNYFGTSLGKYIFGINVNKVGKMSLKDWLIRSFRLWKSGLAFGIPILWLWTFNKQKKLVNKNEQTTYDKLSGICVTANKLSKFQIARAVILFITSPIIIVIALSLFASLFIYIKRHFN